QLVRGHAHHHVQVTGWTPILAGTAPALDPDALPVLHARRNADLDLAGPVLEPRAPARGARRLHLHARAATPRARLAEREEALVLVPHPPAPAQRADDRRRARRRSGALAAAGATATTGRRARRRYV